MSISLFGSSATLTIFCGLEVVELCGFCDEGLFEDEEGSEELDGASSEETGISEEETSDESTDEVSTGTSSPLQAAMPNINIKVKAKAMSLIDFVIYKTFLSII
ncbi:MAG: hypothetical protein IKL62_02170 [Clostridia bacterium]|nr:hypothetical protein [Clostridia bacterium]